MAWTKAYLDSGADRALLVQRLALMATRFGNDPHNQEIPQCLLQDYGKNQCVDRDRLLLACAHISAGHRKYGDTFEAARRFGEAMGCRGTALRGYTARTLTRLPLRYARHPLLHCGRAQGSIGLAMGR